MTLAGAVSAAAAGDAIVLSGSRFVNNAGASALSAPNGRWLVWSSNASPFAGATPDTRNGLAYDFKQYAATYGVTPVAQSTGNGFLYSLAPVITPVLTGTTSKVYDGNAVATLGAANYSAAGAVDGDSVTLELHRRHVRQPQRRNRQGRHCIRIFRSLQQWKCCYLWIQPGLHCRHRKHGHHHAGCADGDGPGGQPHL